MGVIAWLGGIPPSLKSGLFCPTGERYISVHVGNWTVSEEKALYRLFSRQKLRSNPQTPTLNVNGTVVEDMLEKAEALHSAVLAHFSADYTQ